MVEEKTSNKEKLFRKITIVVGVFLVIALIVNKITNPDFDTKTMIIIGLVIAAVTVAIYFLIHVFIDGKKEEKPKEDKLPPPITLEQVREIVSKALVNPEYADYVDDARGEKIVHVGSDFKPKNQIYIRRSYSEFGKDWVFVLVNMNYPEKRSILIMNNDLGDKWWHDDDLKEAANDLAETPQEKPNIREVTNRNTVTGMEQHIKEVIKKEEEKKKEEEEKKEDLK